MKTNSMCAQGTTRGTPMVKVAQVIGGAILVAALAILIGQTTAQPAWAATITADQTPTTSTITSDNGAASANVEVHVSGEPTIVYSVEITWPSLNFTYTFGNNDQWDPTKHEYSSSTVSSGSSTQEGWDRTSAQIKVTNNSNTGINFSAEFSNTSGSTQSPQLSIEDSDVELTLSNASGTIPTAVGQDVGATVLEKNIDLSVSGIPNSTANPVLTEPITITIAKATS